MQDVGSHDDERGIFHVGSGGHVYRRVGGGTVHCALERALATSPREGIVRSAAWLAELRSS